MRPVNDEAASRGQGFPRVSGDAPAEYFTACSGFLFSPRERGCALCRRIVGLLPEVFPA